MPVPITSNSDADAALAEIRDSGVDHAPNDEVIALHQWWNRTQQKLCHRILLSVTWTERPVVAKTQWSTTTTTAVETMHAMVAMLMHHLREKLISPWLITSSTWSHIMFETPSLSTQCSFNSAARCSIQKRPILFWLLRALCQEKYIAFIRPVLLRRKLRWSLSLSSHFLLTSSYVKFMCASKRWGTRGPTSWWAIWQQQRDVPAIFAALSTTHYVNHVFCLCLLFNAISHQPSRSIASNALSCSWAYATAHRDGWGLHSRPVRHLVLLASPCSSGVIFPESIPTTNYTKVHCNHCNHARILCSWTYKLKHTSIQWQLSNAWDIRIFSSTKYWNGADDLQQGPLCSVWFGKGG